MPPCSAHQTGNLDYVQESQLGWCAYTLNMCVGGWEVGFIWDV